MSKLSLITNVLHYLLLLISMVVYLVYPDILPFIIVFSYFLTILILKSLFKLETKETFLVVLSCYLCLFGQQFIFGLYTKISFYDKLLHFIILFFIGVILSKRMIGKDSKIFIYTITLFAILGIASSWEIYEYLYDIVRSSNMQGVFNVDGSLIMEKLEDTFSDLIIGVFGAISSLIYRFWRVK